jgi:AmmeMemoRadiSam system protein A
LRCDPDQRIAAGGCTSFGFYAEPEAALAEDLGERLLDIARASIGRVLGIEHPAHENDPRLYERGACFVTLMRDGRLRGCVGSLEAHRRLLEDVKANARSAAFLDPRFDPLTLTELASTRIEVSLLSVAERLAHSTEDEALAALRPSHDGVILELDDKRATFLPQVWEQMASPREFLAQLKRKAGLAADYWSSELRISRYTVKKWRES